MNQSELIKQNSINRITDGHSSFTDKNGNVGFFHETENNLEYRFNQYSIVNGEIVGRQTKDEVRTKPIVFCGIVAFILEKWNYENDDLFRIYYNEQKRKHLVFHDDDDDKFLRDLEQEFRQQHERQEMSLIQKSQGIFYFLDDNQTKLLNSRIDAYIYFVKNEILEYTDTNSITGITTSEQSVLQELGIEWTDTLENLALINFEFWNNIEKTLPNRTVSNIFENTTKNAFFKMMHNADFTAIHTKGQTQRVQFNIVVLSRIMGENWGEKAVKKIGAKSLRDCGKKTTFEEHSKLKNMFFE
jgi:hypothetical protein